MRLEGVDPCALGQSNCTWMRRSRRLPRWIVKYRPPARYFGTADPRHWEGEWPGAWTVESREAALANLPDFGVRFYTQLFEEFPEFVARAVFLRSSAEPGGDSCVFFDIPNGGFGTQIDADLEYVIVWDTRWTGESGPWDDPVPPALGRVREIVARATGQTLREG